MLPKISVFRSVTTLASLLVAVAVFSAAAHADVTISSAATQNMSCSSGVCAPTATSAVLNVNDLGTMLASGNVEVTTTGSGVQADNIVVSDSLSWSAAGALTLDAYQSVFIDKGIAVQGQGGLTLATDDGGSDGTLTFGHKGNVTFANLSSGLIINGATYTLVNTIASLADAIAANPSGAYALASNYDAAQDGTYTTVPVSTPFTGTFEGLGNAISNLTIDDTQDTEVGLFSEVDSSGTLRDISVLKVNISANAKNSAVGPLVGSSEGNIVNGSASGSVSDPMLYSAGGLVGFEAYGSIVLSRAATRVLNKRAGGLVGILSAGIISESYSSGKTISTQFVGGLVGLDSGGTITNCYATGSTQAKSTKVYDGGFVAQADSGTISDSYSTGYVDPSNRYSKRGGFAGDVSEAAFANDYWDTDTSGFTNLSRGAGNVKYEKGIKGLTTKELQSGLPAGFDPSIWGEDKKTNDGLPYILANPPE